MENHSDRTTPFQRLLAELGADLDPTADEHLLLVDQELEITLSDEGDDVLGLFADVHRYETEDPPVWLLREIAESNFGCAGTLGSTLGLQASTQAVLLCRYWPIGGLPETEVAYIFNLFVETAIHWKERFTERSLAESNPFAGSEPAQSRPREPVETPAPIQPFQLRA